MKPKLWTKQPWEKRVLLINCSNAIPLAVSISNIDVEMYDSSGIEVTSSLIETASIDSTNILVTVRGGDDGENYDMKIKLTLSNGEQVEDDLKIKVREAGQ